MSPCEQGRVDRDTVLVGTFESLTSGQRDTVTIRRPVFLSPWGWWSPPTCTSARSPSTRGTVTSAATVRTLPRPDADPLRPLVCPGIDPSTTFTGRTGSFYRLFVSR